MSPVDFPQPSLHTLNYARKFIGHQNVRMGNVIQYRNLGKFMNDQQRKAASEAFRIVIGFVLIVFSPLSALSQTNSARNFTNQLSFSMDNDHFLLQGKDRYYTNGLFLNFYYIKKKTSSKTIKQIIHYEIGQKIYNAHARKILPYQNSVNAPVGIEQIDRPITGYLFFKASRANFYLNNTLFEKGISVGTIGANSFGKQVQTIWHKKTGVGNYWDWIWDYQLKSEVGVNLHGSYAVSINNKKSIFQVTPITNASLGTHFTNVSQSLVFQLGRFNAMKESSYWNSRLQTSNETVIKKECFFFYKPQLQFQLYNATVQGGFFRENKGPIISRTEPVVINHQVGLSFSGRRYSATYYVCFESKESKSQFNKHSYAGFNFARRF